MVLDMGKAGDCPLFTLALGYWILDNAGEEERFMKLDSDIVVSVVLIRVYHVFKAFYFCEHVTVADDNLDGPSSCLSDSCIEIHRLMPFLDPAVSFRNTDPHDALQLYTRLFKYKCIYTHQRPTFESCSYNCN
jgi:hypothetical protein